MGKEKVRKHILFSGIVQGVGFRYRAYYLAQSMALTGWVKNTWDDKAEMEIQGDGHLIQRFVDALYQEPFIEIDEIEVTDLPLKTECRFHIRD